MSFLQQVRANQISIHALREEGDTLRKRVLRPRQRFLSTPSARRATMCLANIDKRMKISIHALREEGDLRKPGRTSHSQKNFYPRPPRGGRQDEQYRADHRTNFYPRPPRGGRPLPGRAYGLIYNISIHALREEGDASFIISQGQKCHKFLSTPSARRAT